MIYGTILCAPIKFLSRCSPGDIESNLHIIHNGHFNGDVTFSHSSSKVVLHGVCVCVCEQQHISNYKGVNIYMHWCPLKGREGERELFCSFQSMHRKALSSKGGHKRLSVTMVMSSSSLGKKAVSKINQH